MGVMRGSKYHKIFVYVLYGWSLVLVKFHGKLLRKILLLEEKFFGSDELPNFSISQQLNFNIHRKKIFQIFAGILITFMVL